MIDSARPLFPRFSVINPHNSQDEVFCVVHIVCRINKPLLKTRLGRRLCTHVRAHIHTHLHAGSLKYTLRGD